MAARAARLLHLVQLLRRHRAPVTAEALAGELGVSVRSVYRDVDVLREQGAGIEGAAGVGYLLRPGFLLPPLMFTDEELEAIVLGLRLAAEHGDAALERAGADAAAKLRSVLPPDLRAVMDESPLLAVPVSGRPAEVVERELLGLRPRPVGGRSPPPLALVRRCIREQRKARIAYVDPRGARTERTVWPIAVGFLERTRVVLTWCEERRDYRSFRADRIASWSSLRERIGRPRTALLAEWRAREAIPAFGP